MEQKEKFCIVCGRTIPALSKRKVTCSEPCRRRYKCGYAPYKDYEKPPFGELTRYQKEAQKKGMSYGQYVASLTNTERRDKNNG